MTKYEYTACCDEPNGEPIYTHDEVYYLTEHPYSGTEFLYRGMVKKYNKKYVVITDSHAIFYLDECGGANCFVISHAYERKNNDSIILTRLEQLYDALKGDCQFERMLRQHIEEIHNKGKI
jgi:hypothetical protein